MQYTSHGTFWYNLHLVVVTVDRWCEVRNEYLQALHSMAHRTAMKWSLRMSSFGILPDHIHLVFGAPFARSPADISVSFLNNFAFVYGMKLLYQHGAYVGTVGEYTNKAF
jgi:REP element-mobilizing transposase RayT